jgi:hypothetical protein
VVFVQQRSAAEPMAISAFELIVLQQADLG